MASITISAAAARVVTPIAKAPSGSAKLGRSAAPANAAASRVSFPARKPRSRPSPPRAFPLTSPA